MPTYPEALGQSRRYTGQRRHPWRIKGLPFQKTPKDPAGMLSTMTGSYPVARSVTCSF